LLRSGSLPTLVKSGHLTGSEPAASSQGVASSAGSAVPDLPAAGGRSAEVPPQAAPTFARASTAPVPEMAGGPPSPSHASTTGLPRSWWPGAPVCLKGLKAASHLNGLEGSCQEWHSAEGRWSVCFSDGKSKKVKPENLEPAHVRPGVVARFHGLRSAPELNGILGLVEEWLPDEGRWKASLAEGDLKKVKPENLERVPFRPGLRVCLRGLRAAPHLNGLAGTLGEWRPEGRWHVCLSSGEVKKVKPENAELILTLASGMPSQLQCLKASIEGVWKHKDSEELAHISGSSICWQGGTTSELQSNGAPGSFSTELEGEVYSAVFESSRQQLTWDDGDVWIRAPDQDSAKGKVLEAMELDGKAAEDENPWDTTCIVDLQDDFEEAAHFQEGGLLEDPELEEAEERQ